MPTQEIQQTRVRSLGREDSLEKEIATHLGIFAWEILWTEEPEGLLSMGSQELDKTLQPKNNNRRRQLGRTSSRQRFYSLKPVDRGCHRPDSCGDGHSPDAHVQAVPLNFSRREHSVLREHMQTNWVAQQQGMTDPGTHTSPGMTHALFLHRQIA